MQIIAERPYIKQKQDSGFLISVVMLLGLGLLTLAISSTGAGVRIMGNKYHFIERQLVFCAIGVFLMIVVSLVPLNFIKKVLPVIVFGTLILCALVFVPGLGGSKKGATRWLNIGDTIELQPSEMVKVAIILFLGNIFSKDEEEHNLPVVVKAAIVLFAFDFVILLQNDFSTALFITIIGLVMFFIAGVKIRYFVGFCAVGLPIAFLFLFTKAYRVNRVIGFFNRTYDVSGLNFQVNAARKAISSGGFWGAGITSTLRCVTSIPEVQSDFVFAGWTEAMGFVGVLIYFALLTYFAVKGYQASLRCSDKFSGYTSFGLVTCIVLQSLLNCGVVCGALPSTGIPLPFFSSGGTSLLITLLSCGLLLNIFRTDNKSMEGSWDE